MGRDRSTGFYNSDARQYDSDAGRFIVSDTCGPIRMTRSR
jgi:hypothetical protein